MYSAMANIFILSTMYKDANISDHSNGPAVYEEQPDHHFTKIQEVNK